MIWKSYRHLASPLSLSNLWYVSCSISVFKYFINYISSFSFIIFYSLSTIIRSTSEWITAYPSSKNKSSTIGASSAGQL